MRMLKAQCERIELEVAHRRNEFISRDLFRRTFPQIIAEFERAFEKMFCQELPSLYGAEAITNRDLNRKAFNEMKAELHERFSVLCDESE